MTISTHRSKVARMIPTVLIKNFFSSLLILVITKHHVLSSGNNLTRNICRIRTDDLYLHIQDRCTTRAWNKVFVITISYHRTTFRCSITTGHREINTYQEVFNLLIKSSSAGNKFIRIATKGFHNNRTDSFLHLLANNRHLQQHTSCRTLHLWKDILTNNLLNNHWYCNNNSRTNISTSLSNQRRTRQSCKEI